SSFRYSAIFPVLIALIEERSDDLSSVSSSNIAWFWRVLYPNDASLIAPIGPLVIVDSDELGQRFRSKVDGDSDARWYSKGVSALEGLLINSCVHFGSS